MWTNISKSLENMKTKFIHDITVYIFNESLKTFYSLSPPCSGKFVNRNRTASSKYNSVIPRPYVLNTWNNRIMVRNGGLYLYTTVENLK